ncbi:hypothetical protein LCGC14_2396080 [marine sediment metagenome]|uniref:Uncharacterized protein n=1 Tax=marine sediment metagenome TaxID=412755 RepID=A0A0F9ER65_9ZZZZ
MAAKFHVTKNGVVTAVTAAGKKNELRRGNPAGEGPGVGKYSVKVRPTGPISGD